MPTRAVSTNFVRWRMFFYPAVGWMQNEEKECSWSCICHQNVILPRTSKECGNRQRWMLALWRMSVHYLSTTNSTSTPHLSIEHQICEFNQRNHSEIANSTELYPTIKIHFDWKYRRFCVWDVSSSSPQPSTVGQLSTWNANCRRSQTGKQHHLRVSCIQLVM